MRTVGRDVSLAVSRSRLPASDVPGRGRHGKGRSSASPHSRGRSSAGPGWLGPARCGGWPRCASRGRGGGRVAREQQRAGHRGEAVPIAL
eukprot:scaffold24708_cov67-Phaeocystis_antarctica.AAC.10